MQLCKINTVVKTNERFEKLVESLELPKEKLSDSHVVQLRELCILMFLV